MFKNEIYKNRLWYQGAVTLVLVLVGCLFQNCSIVGSPLDVVSSAHLSSVSSAPSKFVCNAGATPMTSPLLRLTKRQYVNTIRSLVGRGLAPNDLVNLDIFFNSAGVVSAIGSIPNDGIAGKGNSMVYDTADQRLSVGLASAQIDLAMQAAQWVSGSPSRLSYFVKKMGGAGCSSETINNTGVSKACLDGFIQGFGLRALRRPLQAGNSSIDSSSSNPSAMNDLGFYEAVYLDGVNGGFDSLIAALFVSPESIFISEFQGSYSTATNSVLLNPYELAAKLSYYFTDSPPDEALLGAAAAQFQGSGLSLQEQVDRLFGSNEARGRMSNFYTQWIRPEVIPVLNPTNDSPQTDLGALRSNAIQEMIDLTDYYTFGVSNGTLADLATSQISFAKTADLANVYGVATWKGRNADSSYDPSALVRFSSANPRAGLFTRAGYAFSGARDNNLIIRGARLRKDFLCYNFSPPANVVLSTNVVTDGPPTVRNVVAANTEVGTCMGCHKPLINPLGNSLENYDSFGRYRVMEPIFDSTGRISQSVPVNAQSSPHISLADQTATTDGVGFSQTLGNSFEFNSCFVRHYFRFAEARMESDVVDGCELNDMLNSLSGTANGGLQAMIKSTAKSAVFQRRQIKPY